MSRVIGPVKRATASRLGKAGIAIPVAAASLDAPIEATLKRRVTGGFIVAVLLTVFMGFSSWRSIRLAAKGADWVAHTYAVMGAVELTAKHVLEFETSARTFGLTGQDRLLADYENAKSAVAGEEEKLRSLTADSPNERHLLDVLDPQVRVALEFAESMIAKRRRTHAVAGADEVLETERLMDAVSATTEEMRAEEMRLLSQSTPRTGAERRLTSFIVVVGVLVAAGLLTVARFAINREIDVSARGREELKALNADLEGRVDQRTAALQTEVAERTQAEQRLTAQAEKLARSEREVRKLNDELERRVTQRTALLETANKELEAFSYSVSHDLRAPLRHISSFSKMLLEEFGPALDANAQRYVERIQVGTQKMGLLVDELLNLARVGRHVLRPQPTGLNSIVAELIAMLQPDGEGREVQWVIAELPAVECDPVLVRQVFQNLLANALKFTRPRAHTVIEVSHKVEDGQPVFMVRDNGVGFNMKYVDKLFGVFQRLHSSDEFEGTGIGLVTVQRIVHKHGGRVWAEAEADKGAAFYFTLGMGKPVESKNKEASAGGQS